MPTIISSNNVDYISVITKLIKKDVMDNVNKRGICNMILTGGRTAKLLYRYWFESCPWDHKNIMYYFGDERCVPSDSKYSNFAMVVTSLFPDGVYDASSVNKMNGDTDDLLYETKRYEKLLPAEIDILLLSVGEDGHIASLFPNSKALYESDSSVVSVTSPKSPKCRLTITPKVINSAKKVFVFASGTEKGKILAKAVGDQNNIDELPVRLTIGATWILDEDALNAFNATTNNKHHNTRIEHA